MKNRRNHCLLFLLFILVLGGCKGPAHSGYTLLEDTPWTIEVEVLAGSEEGKTVYVVAGIHGDEQAGWMAAEQLKTSEISVGTMYIVSPANAYGAEHQQRKTKDLRDLNRNFPGSDTGSDAQQIAAAIYKDIQEKQPDIVLDLHEAVAQEGTRDNLENVLICQSLSGIEDLILMLLDLSGQPDSGFPLLTLYGSPPSGSINQVVTQGLNIPVITIETARADELEQRIAYHLALVKAITVYINQSELVSP